MLDIWLYFIKIHNLNTYDTLYIRHKQVVDLTFSVISKESKYVNYLVRAKGFFVCLTDSAFTVKGEGCPGSSHRGKPAQAKTFQQSHLARRASIAQLSITLLVRHNLTTHTHE